ncbi:MAG: c-type cytochrome [Janthinobacterium lividum]
MSRKTLHALCAAAVIGAAGFLPALLPGSGTDIAYAGSNGGENKAPAVPVNADALVKRGQYLAAMGDCIACHTPRGAKPYSGNYAVPSPFGTMYTPNLTPDNDTGIGKWTSDDFYRAMHDGVSKDGSYLYPAFPFTSYTKMSRADTDAIFAYLKSLEPVHSPQRANDMPFPFNQRIILLGWRILFFRKGEYTPDAAQSAEWNRGRYLVDGAGHCAMCHTQLNPLGSPYNGAAFSGGLIPIQDWYAPSLTSDARLGIGSWSVEDLSQFLTTGVSDKGAVYGPMADVVHNSTQYMSAADARAMAVYLKSIPQKKPAPKPMQFEVSEAYGEQLFKAGAKIYQASCAECHGDHGQGRLPHFPRLANNQSIMMHSSVNPIRMVLNGGYPPVTSGNPRPYGMPPFAQTLSDREVAAVVTYIRKAWDNGGEAVSPQQVNELRSAPLD